MLHDGDIPQIMNVHNMTESSVLLATTHIHAGYVHRQNLNHLMQEDPCDNIPPFKRIRMLLYVKH